MKVAVTGGSGRLGTLVLRRLAVDRTVSGIVSLDLKPPRIASKKLIAVHADIRDEDLARHIEGCDALVHMACIAPGIPATVSDAMNIGASRNVLQAAVAAGVKRIVVLPTPRVEGHLDAFEADHPNIAVVRLRPALLVGGCMEPPLGAALRRRVLLDLGSAPMSVVWDEDVADAIVLGLKKDVRGAFDLVANDAQRISEIAPGLGLQVLRPPSALVGPLRQARSLLVRAGLRQVEALVWPDNVSAPPGLDSAKAKAELGWKPKCPTALDVLKRCLEVVPAATDRRLRVFFRLLSLAPRGQQLPADAAKMNARMHLSLTGPGGGDFDVALQGGKLSAKPGIPRPPTVTVITKATTFLDLLGGRLDFSTAQLTGKIRMEGEALDGLLMQGIVSGFRQQAREAGPRAWPVRRLAAWMEGPPRKGDCPS